LVAVGILVSMTNVRVRMLKPPEADDAALVDRVTALVNGVYADAESGLWRDGTPRTTHDEMAGLIRTEQIVVAGEDEIAGSVRLRDVADDASEFGLLAAAGEHRGAGVGRALLDFAEEKSRSRGMRAMQLELLLPREWQHPSKEFLKDWYGRRGYRVIHTRSVEETHPHLAPLLATPCYFAVYEKQLQDGG
jgi:GNAT superfamily N-acetyltransferase